MMVIKGALLAVAANFRAGIETSPRHVPRPRGYRLTPSDASEL